MKDVDCSSASSTESAMSPTLERDSVSDLSTFSATPFPMPWYVATVSQPVRPLCRQQIAHNRAVLINAFIYVNHGPSSDWGNHHDMPSDVTVEHKVT